MTSSETTGWMLGREALARPLPDEVPRQRLIDQLAQRWVTTVTVIEAAGGYGKTRAISQAVRDNGSDPSGLDIVFRVQPRHGASRVFASELAEMFVGGFEGGGSGNPASLIDSICARMAAAAPARVALILDDVHHLVGADESVHLVEDLLLGLPTNGRLVLSGRSIPDIAVARLEAADQVSTLTAQDLAFTAAERAELAAGHGVDVSQLDHLAGWPAMVRLSLVMGRRGPESFLAEEVIERLSAEEREAVAAAVLAGFTDDALLERCDIHIAVSALVDRVPLVDLIDTPDGPTARPHDLWHSALDQLISPTRTAELAAQISPWHSAAGRHDQAISTAAVAQAWPDGREAVMVALSATDVRLSADLLARWSGLFPTEQRDEPELVFLRGMHARLAKEPTKGADEIAEAMAGFCERGDATNEARALYENVFLAFLMNDTDRIGDAVARIPRLLEAGVTSLAPLIATMQVIAADMNGDFAGAIKIATASVEPGIPTELSELRLRYLTTLWFLVGDGDQAVARATELIDLEPSPRNLFVRAMARFANGSPDDLLAGWDHYRYLQLGNARDDFLHGVFSSMAAAAIGEPPEVDRIREIAWGRSREQIFIALCDLVAGVVAENGEAETRFATRVADLGLTDPLVAGEIRRFLAIAYVADPAVRAYVDADDESLGPYHRRQRDLARILLDLRDGAEPDWSGYIDPGKTLTVLPLRWSVELACGLATHDLDGAIDLTELLLRAGGARAHVQIRGFAQRPGPAQAGAELLLRSLPAPPPAQTTITSAGELTISRQGMTHTPKRARVRQLLCLLILRGSIERDEVIDLLWPGRDPDSARQNLATNLSYLRTELEPGRKRGEPPFHVRQKGSRIELHRSEYLNVDLWSMLEDSDASTPTIAATPLPDLHDVAELTPDLAAIEVHLRDKAAARAEALIAAGDHDAAAEIASSLLVQDRYDERAHRALIGANLGTGDIAAARTHADAALSALGELGIDPSESLRMLLRQLGGHQGTHDA